jgi:hypothetical protein
MGKKPQDNHLPEALNKPEALRFSDKIGCFAPRRRHAG